MNGILSNVDWKTFIPLLIAIYGAILSTILAVRGYLKDKRNLKVFLEAKAFHEKAHFRLVNTGLRPITIISISMKIFIENDGANPPHWENVPDKDILESIPNATRVMSGTIKPFMAVRLISTLPVHIKDGEQVLLPITDMIYKMLLNNRTKPKVYVKDADGNVYDKYKVIGINPKFQTVPEVKRE